MYSWRSSIIMLSAVIVMAMLVINVRHQSRVLTVQLEQARAQEQQLQVEWSTRQVQQVAAAKNDKIAEVVSGQNMQRVDPSMTFYITPDGAPVRREVNEIIEQPQAPVSQPNNKISNKPANQTTTTPAQKPASKPAVKSMNKPTTQPANPAANKPAANKPAAKPSDKTTTKPASKPAAKPKTGA